MGVAGVGVFEPNLLLLLWPTYMLDPLIGKVVEARSGCEWIALTPGAEACQALGVLSSTLGTLGLPGSVPAPRLPNSSVGAMRLCSTCRYMQHLRQDLLCDDP